MKLEKGYYLVKQTPSCKLCDIAYFTGLYWYLIGSKHRRPKDLLYPIEKIEFSNNEVRKRPSDV